MKTFMLIILLFSATAFVTAGQQANQVKDRVRAQEKDSKKEPAREQEKGKLPEQQKGQAQSQISAQTDECDCTIFPYKPAPPCPTQCTTRTVLATATEDELILVVGVNENLAKQIAGWKEKNGARPSFLGSYSEVLTEAQMKSVNDKLQGLTGPQINYFHLPVAERVAKFNALKSILNRELLYEALGRRK